ncbi:hypothetical protein NP233_g9992 [Leucocoprinus birnbaumii]|uniref:Nephrocystin 3-like N-terminal domain-containing protein n=1 Tax=Leucocoprinus birnbaumii TaxID=56174 RepID=A0AAD5VLS6_9AGAR|nr:hypothetical protein NP233_g9992 [Leucocoprinus birnbaumii]
MPSLFAPKIKGTSIKIAFFGGKPGSKKAPSTSSASPPPNSATSSQTRALPSSEDSSSTQALDRHLYPVVEDDSDSGGFVGQVMVEATGGGLQISAQSGTDGQGTSIDFFKGASEMLINNSTFQEIHTGPTVHNVVHKTVNKQFNNPTFVAEVTQNIENGEQLISLLSQRRIPGTDLINSSREPPPRCHPETRREIRDKLEAWFQDPAQRHSFLIWLAGPAGAGKSAVAQTFAEYCRDNGARLGAAYFFSTLNRRGDMDGFIPGIVCDLILQFDDYKQQVTKILADTPGLLNQSSLEVQFRKLIVEPFEALTPADKPLVIVIDGLDECDNKRAQCNLIRIIGEYATSPKAKRYPILWLICSRPELHIQAAFARARMRIGRGIEDITAQWYLRESSGEVESRIDYIRQDITCNAAEDIKDVYLILRDGLREIGNDLGLKEWPRESQLQELSHCVCGLPILAATVIKFISCGWNHPQDRLELCLMNLRDLKTRIGKRKPGTNVNPLEALDIFYTAIMNNVDPHALVVAKHLISFLVILAQETRWPDKISTALDTRVFFDLGKIEFEGVFQDFHSVLNIPPAAEAHERQIQFFHKSFGEFLQNRDRAKGFALDMAEARLEIARHAIRIYQDIIRSDCKREGLPTCFNFWPRAEQLICLFVFSECHPNGTSPSAAASSHDDFHDPGWYEEDQLTPNPQLRRFVRSNFWDMLCIDDSKRNDVIELLHDFEFCHLPFVPAEVGDINEAEGLPRFMSWMSKAMDTPEVNTILRVKPISEEDHLLLNHCLTEPPLRKRLPKYIGEQHQYTYSFISSHRQDRSERTVPATTKMAFWMGVGGLAVLGLLDGSEGDVDDDDDAARG